jgi:hypothetical protein
MTDTVNSTMMMEGTPATALARRIPTEELAVELMERAQADGALVDGDAVDPWRQLHGVLASPSGADRYGLVRVPELLQAGVSLPPVSDHDGARSDAGQDEAIEGRPAGVRDPSEPDPPRSLAPALDRHRDQGFLASLTTVQARFVSADEGLVDLEIAAQQVAAGHDHRTAQLVQPRPGRLVAAQAEQLLDHRSFEHIRLRAQLEVLFSVRGGLGRLARPR